MATEDIKITVRFPAILLSRIDEEVARRQIAVHRYSRNDLVVEACRALVDGFRDMGAAAMPSRVLDHIPDAAKPSGKDGKLQALVAKLGIKTLAQVEAGETAKPTSPELMKAFSTLLGPPIDCPVEDVPTVSWAERLTSAQRKLENEQDYDTMAELLRGIRVPAGWLSWAMPKRISWLDEKHPIIEDEF